MVPLISVLLLAELLEVLLELPVVVVGLVVESVMDWEVSVADSVAEAEAEVEVDSVVEVEAEADSMAEAETEDPDAEVSEEAEAVAVAEGEGEVLGWELLKLLESDPLVG